MKVLHVSTFDIGGAGRAAIGLHKALLQAGVDSNFLCLSKKTNTERVFQFRYQTPLPRKVLTRFGLTRLERAKKQVRRQGGVCKTFTFPYTGIDISGHPLVQEADIISLHWVSWFVDYPTFFKRANRPLVWTLHDMNPFQGGFHYLDDRLSNHWPIEERLEEFKYKILAAYPLLRIVVLNNWMLQQSTASRMFKNRPHTVIHNSLELTTFMPMDKQKAREDLGLPSEGIIILFVSMSLSDRRKGGDLLAELGKDPATSDVLFCAVGEERGIGLANCILYGPISDDKKMAKLYSAADATILPSREDNLPNVLLESLACGTPVIATPVGAMGEIIKHGENGYLAEEVTVQALKNALMLFIDTRRRFDRTKIARSAASIFSPELQARRYIALYREMLG